ncbi:DUF3426 domain-containing protein [Desulfuromonas sp.]|uniref:DUF3426 domain-containing protein n=1 Tax=Desulfuromonas sp. TaxID=892 RepID=UPI0025BEBC86|nr:DUF3426 domain-containing protein [Desulfuromonas sp.]
MVIQCPDCQTRFNVADSKIKPGGAKLRCSRCQHVFRVMPPAAPETPAAPAPTQPSPGGEAFFPPSGEEESAARVDPFAEEPLPPELGMAEDSPPPVPTAEPELPEEPEQEPADQPDGWSWPGSSDEVEDAFGGGFDTPALSSGGEPFSGDEDSGERSDGFDDLGALAGPGEKEPEPFSGETDEFTWDESDESGFPVEFDFNEGKEAETAADDFGQSPDPIQEQVTPAEPAGGGDALALELDQLPPSANLDPPLDDLSDEEGGLKAKPLPIPPPPKRRSPFWVLTFFLLALLAALVGVVGYFLWKGETPSIESLLSQFSSRQQAPEAGKVKLTDLTGFFVENREIGRMFVIKGMAVNEYPETRSAIAVKGILFDRDDNPLLQQTAFCGNPLDNESLRNLPFATIEEHMNNQFGDTLSNLNVASGKALPFAIVFRNLPPDLSEFTAEVVDSRPGTEQE